MEPSRSKFIDFRGAPVELRYAKHLRDTAGHEAHAATYIRERLIVLDEELKRDPAEHARVLIHEVFHFVWLRLGNTRRISWERLLQHEWNRAVRGEAGWSAEWRKSRLTAEDMASRSRRWREYCCEAFCDTAAANQTGGEAERTLSVNRLRARMRWFASNVPEAPHI